MKMEAPQPQNSTGAPQPQHTRQNATRNDERRDTTQQSERHVPRFCGSGAPVLIGVGGFGADALVSFPDC